MLVVVPIALLVLALKYFWVTIPLLPGPFCWSGSVWCVGNGPRERGRITGKTRPSFAWVGADRISREIEMQCIAGSRLVVLPRAARLGPVPEAAGTAAAHRHLLRRELGEYDWMGGPMFYAILEGENLSP